MPIEINRSVLGKEYPPYPVTVERGRLKDFARAIGDLNPFYLDDRAENIDAGAARGWQTILHHDPAITVPEVWRRLA